MKESFKEKIARANNLLDVLLIMKEKTSMDINVASLAYVSDIIKKRSEDKDVRHDYGILTVKPFPLHIEQEEYAIQGYYFNQHNYEVGDIVLVIYTDLNFIPFLNDTTQKPKVSNDEDYHSLRHAIVIPLEETHKENEQEE